MKVTPNAITNSATLLEALPSQERYTLRETIEILYASIEAARQKGYSYEELALIMKDQGVPVSVSSLKRYMTEVRASIKQKSRKTRKTGKAGTTVDQSTQADAAVVAGTSVMSEPDEPTLVEVPGEVVADTKTVEVEAEVKVPSQTLRSRKGNSQSAGNRTTKGKSTQSTKTAARSKASFRTRATAGKKSKTSR